ncbi:hypothetical protein KY290_031492 [Solanum tuberosum]|uniref:Gag-pol polyprotein n=1 Tax=Solanum tuberosum TaxID=4113 RepID=A0ABQ7U9B9_SOLTU|nr:hypothetical protein KY289_030871 [Solanum tuberosum]KAH0743499.1 hypothetical protein KY290_031492 [Solanum tuberosum]
MMQQVSIVNQVDAMINQDESQRFIARSTRVFNDHLTPTAMFIKGNTRSTTKSKKLYNPNSYCDHCHMKGHILADCYKLMKCDYFHLTGHVKLDCYSLYGYPIYFKGKKRVNRDSKVSRSGQVDHVINTSNLFT